MEPENIAIWIPFLAIPLGIGMIITLMVLLHRAKIRELDQRHRERMAAIEKGLDPGYFGAATESAEARPAGLPGADQPRRYLLRGLVWLGVGVAFVIAAGPVTGNWAALPGWIAAAVGGAYVVYYMMEGRRSPPPPVRPPTERPPGPDQAP